MVEPQPSKLMTWVRFPSPAPSDEERSSPIDGKPAHVAQLVEHVLGKDEVTGSIPVVGSTCVERTVTGQVEQLSYGPR